MTEEGFLVDRKFHLGMQAYVSQIKEPILSVHPETNPGELMMDPVNIPFEQLGYRVMTLKTDHASRPLAGELDRLREQILQCRLVYGNALGSIKLARELGVPYILLLECDLRTQITINISQVSHVVRKLVRAARCILNYVAEEIPDMRAAYSLHCNGYPVFDESGKFNSNRLLYLDSRMSVDMVIPEEQLKARLSSRTGRPLRLLFSGRYEPLKGAVDAVRVAIECLTRGLDIEMHCYGQGSLYSEMKRLAAGYSRIHVYDAIPFPELVERSRSFDLFICCHIQSDPSCTYLESFGAALPIIGYSNRMWHRLNDESGVGFRSPIGRPREVADHVQILASNFELLEKMSMQARHFALEHTFEREFAKRIEAMNTTLQALPAS
jgi:glycosyltransferase involved in cell wall biosynthesis